MVILFLKKVNDYLLTGKIKKMLIYAFILQYWAYITAKKIFLHEFKWIYLFLGK